MKGKSTTGIDPAGTVTLAETVTMACRIHHIYNGGDGVFKQPSGSGWYWVYVDYALSKGILTKSFDNYNRPATRAEFADILSRAVPAKEYSWVNVLPASGIPDVDRHTPYYDSAATAYIAWDEVVAIREYADYDPDNEANNADNRTATYYFENGELFCVRFDYDYYDRQINIYYEEGKLLLIQDDVYLYCQTAHPEGAYFATLPDYIAPNYEHISNTWRNFVW